MTIAPYTLYGPFLVAKVRGLPVGQGAIRHLGAGRPAIHANAKTLKPWRAQIQAAVEEHIDTHWGDTDMGRAPQEGPVGLLACFTMPKPKSAPKRRRTWPDRRPDLSHLLRAAEDAVVASGAIRDDSQFVDEHIVKAFPGEHAWALHVPGLWLALYEVGTDHSSAQLAAEPQEATLL